MYHESLALYGENLQNIGSSGNYYKNNKTLIRELEMYNGLRYMIETMMIILH